MVATVGAGPLPIPYKVLSSDKLAEAINFCLTPEAFGAAQRIAVKMRLESGVKTAVDSFHRNLPLDRLKCDILPDQPAAWIYKKSKWPIKLSRIAAQVLIHHLKVDWKNLKQSVNRPNPFLLPLPGNIGSNY